MDYTQIVYEVADHIATITLNRPEQLNAFTNTMMREVIDAFDRVDADDDVRVVIVTGAGRGFCAGADLSGGGETFSRGGSDEQTDVGVPRSARGRSSPRDRSCQWQSPAGRRHGHVAQGPVGQGLVPGGQGQDQGEVHPPGRCRP